MERTARIPAAVRAPVRGPKRLLALRSDARLVDLVRAGDDIAFEILYERYAANILGFCRHMLGSQEEAEDAAQQAFVAAHGALRRGGSEIAFKPWLYTIARNRCLSMLRARREQPAELAELSTAGLNEQVEQRADLRELVQDVQRLPERQRAALLLSELDDLSHPEVAAVIGCKPQAVKGLVFRARSGLAERRAARSADCEEIRAELAAAKGGGLRRGRLRYHVESCPACAAYLDEVHRQRRLLGLALPVVPALALKDGVMAKAGIGAAGAAGVAGAGGGGAGLVTAAGSGAAGAAAGGAATVGGTLLGGTAVKLAVAGAILAGGAGVATEVVREGGDAPPADAPSKAPQESPSGSPGNADGATPARGVPAARALERRRGGRGAERRALGQQRAAERSGGRAKAGERPGAGPGRMRGKDQARGNGGARADRGQRGQGQPQGEGGGQPPGTGPSAKAEGPAVPQRDVGRGGAGTGEAPGLNGSSGAETPAAPRKSGGGEGGAPPAQARGNAGKTLAPPSSE